jgi:hypothetical protein
LLEQKDIEPASSKKVSKGKQGCLFAFLALIFVGAISCGVCVANVFDEISLDVSSECKDAIYDDIRLYTADEPRRFYVHTKLEDWTQGQLAAAIDEGGYLENIEPCRTEVRAEFDRRGYSWE